MNITEITRKEIMRYVMESRFHWSGELEEPEFLKRIYPLEQLPSRDSRFDSAESDIWQHRINNYDWEDDWIFEDDRFQLADGEDELFLKFLIESVHPVVRPNMQEARELVEGYNSHLQYDGYELYVESRISGRAIYGYKEIIPTNAIYDGETSEKADYDDVWGEGIFRVFISHTARWKADAEKLKKALQRYGIASFVAHTDVDPTLQWLQEIEKALRSMDLIVPLMTSDFRESKWTDQEVGAAIGRDVPVFPVKVECDPHGFMEKIQAIVVGDRDLDFVANNIVKGLLINDAVSHNGKSAVDAVLIAMDNAYSFDQGNLLATLLPHISALSSQQEESLVLAHNENSQISGAYGFRDHILGELKRLTGNIYVKEAGDLVRS